jgi:distribution and morphology protein 10
MEPGKFLFIPKLYSTRYTRLTRYIQRKCLLFPDLLDFPTPKGLHLTVSSLATPHFATSYTGALAGPVNGSLSYLYSSIPISIPSKSGTTPLSALIKGYRHVLNPPLPEHKRYWEIWHRGQRVDQRASLLYGRVFLPTQRLEALYLRRSTPSRLIQLRGVSDVSLPNGGSLLGIVHNDYGKYSLDTLFSTDSALLGVRGLYHFTPSNDEEKPQTEPVGLFSMGAEVYYALLNKSGGLSTAFRFTTLPNYHSFPYTMTVTLNPLMGNLSSTYSVKAGKYLSLCSRFDFNFYSYASGVVLGAELWRLKRKPSLTVLQKVEQVADRLDIPPSAVSLDDFTINPATEKAADAVNLKPKSVLQSLDYGFVSQAPDEEDVAGVLKARIDQDWKIGLVWEGRFKELLVTVGGSLNLKRKRQIFSGFGIELQYSS